VIAVIRTSLSIRAIDDKITAARNNILIAMLFTILAAALVSLLVSRKIIHPVEQMKLGAAKFARGDLAARLTAPDSEELSELAVTMNQMAENLDEKIKAFENRSKELEAVHGSMQEGVIAIDRDERIITINAAAARILDFPPGELKTRYILEVVRNMEFQKFIENALATHEPIERDIRIAGNENLILNIHSTALYNADNQRMGTLVIFHDITRIRRLETMHKDFAANVSHELKTPLTTIKGFIETLQEMAMGQHTDEAHNFLTIIEKNVNRMVDLIDDLLALSRLERLQGTDLFFESQDIAGLIRGAVQSCEAGITAKNICVTVDCPDDLTARVDPLLLEQAIFNLVDNAVKYNPAGNPVSIAASRNGSHLKIQVTDTGAGIPSEHLPKIFNRFYRIDPSRSRNEGGTGLGLAIVKHIVQYHRGKVDVQSGKDRGSTFTICIPA
jgi:two-component system phosphate regulon sensor histidine kinase PhoR